MWTAQISHWFAEWPVAEAITTFYFWLFVNLFASSDESDTLEWSPNSCCIATGCLIVLAPRGHTTAVLSQSVKMPRKLPACAEKP
jgi:hypothetical protein